ncbi:efflux RND transporter permease subunit [Roseicella frigidaeris]|uniref:Acriflavine resistance protein B n=1 Tax=Roseicella frigidaeris TaxID=2230885 RepID=A0A327MAI2_9PROT|nr:efflux RND transporter permease subunit [Roseicella frigidaeris]RAI60301.1 acriflavine resistance protein B [Roseicella frigidaeris]
MSFSAPFILRPVATGLLALGIALIGLLAYALLPIAPLPRTDLPTVAVGGVLPGADPETIAASVVAPLERRIGAIAGVAEMTSWSSLGAFFIVTQFELGRSSDGAARDVQAAINAAGSDMAPLPSSPWVGKFNPGDAPVLIMSLTSPVLTPGAIYDLADSIVLPRISQVPGVARVQLQGAEQPAIRIAVDPAAAKAAGVSMERVRQAINENNVTQPTGTADGREQFAAVSVNDRLTEPDDYARMIVKRDGQAVVRVGAIGRVAVDARDRRQGATLDGQRAVLLTIFKQADANVIEVFDGIQALVPQFERWLPGGVRVETVRDRSDMIRASVHDVQRTLLVSILLVVLVVALFLRRVSAILATGIAVPLSLFATLAAMWLAGFSLDNLSLMALTISVGFVVDDAIVMTENIARLRERGLAPLAAALEGARQIGFTVVSITVSLIAVFIPLLFMEGVVGRLFREFSLTLAIAVAASGLVSLSVTPAMAAHLARRAPPPPGRLGRAIERGFAGLTAAYVRSLGRALRHQRAMLLGTLGLVGTTVWLYLAAPKSFFPDQDTGFISGTTFAAADTSYQAMVRLQERVVAAIQGDPAVARIASITGVGNSNGSVTSGRVLISLRPLAERPGISANEVIERLRAALAAIPGIETTLRAVPEINIGGRSDGAAIQFVLLSADAGALAGWSEALVRKLRTVPGLNDVSSDQQNPGPITRLAIDRDAAARLGVSVQAIAQALNSAFAQRQVSIIYRARNQYRVVLEIEPGLQQRPEQVDDVWLSGRDGRQVPLAALVALERSTAPTFITHRGQFPAATITFNPAPGLSLGEATAAVERAAAEIGLPDTMRTEFAGNARAFQSFTRSQPLLILAALVTIYIVLGMLYEHALHPITILSTLPTAGIGALLALRLFGLDFSVIALVGVILLMGIVKKNAIMMVDFALEHERIERRGAEAAILEACRERFRPILMTTVAAVLGALPLALETGAGSELRRPLGVTVIGGLLLCQVITLYTTPAIYLAMERLQVRLRRWRRRGQAVPAE